MFASQEFDVRFQGKNTMPDIDDKARQLPASFDGPYLLNKQDVERNQAEVMRIYLPGKQPPWRRVGKVDCRCSRSNRPRTTGRTSVPAWMRKGRRRRQR